jgi:alkylhydroperoxidase family enzyme
LGISDEKLHALADWERSDLFGDRECLVLAYADAMTLSDRDVDDDLFERLRSEFTDEEIVALTAAIAWENASSKFNRALRVPSQGLCESVRSKAAR